MVIKLFKLDLSPPSRACMMACEIFKVPVQMIDVNLLESEKKKAEFLKINILRTIPILEDGDIILHDSHSIIIYLAEAYGKQDNLYPKDIKRKALVDQKLFFNSSFLLEIFRNVTQGILRRETKLITKKQLNQIHEAYEFLEEFLNQTRYLAGDQFTIADVAAYATTSSLVHILELNSQKYPKIQAWLKEIDEQPFAQNQNESGATFLTELLDHLMNT